MKHTKLILYLAATLVSLLLTLGAWLKWLPLDLVEVLGFVTGGWCVWLTVKENIWNWPIGIANSAFFAILFLRGALYADMGLQIIYIVLGFWGWYFWIYGGEKKNELPVTRVSYGTLMVLGVLGAISTYAMTVYLQSINDAAPFWDASTTALSLVAQYLLTKKYIENWHFWIIADVIYIGLYFYKDLYLTGILYAIFLLMCLRGLLEWKNSLKKIWINKQPESTQNIIVKTYV